MIRWSNKVQISSAGAELARSAEERAYVLLEESRIRAELLLDSPHASTALDEIRRCTGLAGYHACTWMEAEPRLQALARARDQAALAVPPRTGADALASVDALELRVDRALDALDEALALSPSNDHLHLAQTHALAARQTMRGPLLSQRIGNAP